MYSVGLNKYYAIVAQGPVFFGVPDDIFKIFSFKIILHIRPCRPLKIVHSV